MATQSKPKAGNDRNQRIRDRLFPNADQLVFKTGRGGFVPLPIVLRRLLKYLKPNQLELLMYLSLRSDKNGLCFPTYEEIGYELDQQSNHRLRKIVNELEKMCFLSTRSSEGRTYFLLHDPKHAIARLYEQKTIPDDDLKEMNDLLEKLGLGKVEVLPAGARRA